MKLSTEDEHCERCGINTVMQFCECKRIAELTAERDEARKLVTRLSEAWRDEHWCAGEFIPYDGFATALEDATEAVKRWESEE